MMPIFVRIDHRMADAVELGQFTGAIRDYMTNPETIPRAVGEARGATENAHPTLAISDDSDTASPPAAPPADEPAETAR